MLARHSVPLQVVRSFNYSTSRRNAHSAIRRFAQNLEKTQPAIHLQAKDVTIHSKPQDFKNVLLDMIRRARRRIFFSSLYIGESEQYLIDALGESLLSNPSLRLSMVLDYNRSTRPGPKSTASLLLPLIQQYSDRVDISLFRSPKLKGIMAKAVPRRFDEGWGTWHAKIYGVDDDVLISGANLNESYFTDRQDRYLHFKSAGLSEYCFNFLSTVTPFCYRLKTNSGPDGYSLHWPDPNVHPQRIESKLGKSFREFQDSNRQAHPPSCSGSDVTIYPIIQGRQFGIMEEENCIDMLFRSFDGAQNNEPPLVDLTSGYFGLSKSYQELVRTSRADCRLLCASPKANGFYGSRGISGRIPEGYTFLEQRFWKGVVRSGRDWKSEESGSGHGVQLHEWSRPGWTYHAKGIWVSPHQGEPPILTLFGSTNLNSRSANLDTELAFVMVLPESNSGDASGDDVMLLRRKLADEIAGLRQFAVPWEGAQRRVRAGTKVLVNLVGGML
ncbi:CDP-diacylglycerol-glycerol-3-phosphate 3-phosphatidyltransferase [Schizopora paradoxa]|uniref:CDP-diacylglycerol--glycerol-3-phosphate 3-phosphatidyltransferase n=1 Tax=Schizopora paradoxa TaxID=27342 RepID=A0A0H2R7I6_9AGAM|nr:CDP-diacylglycerol-glycerol-3-phosphate 3-phosphatidyltransferase [Schizopora paradoxa]